MKKHVPYDAMYAVIPKYLHDKLWEEHKKQINRERKRRVHKDCGNKVTLHPGSVATKYRYYHCYKCNTLVREDETEIREKAE